MDLEDIPDWMEPFDQDLLAPSSYELEQGHSCDGEIDFDSDISGEWKMP